MIISIESKKIIDEIQNLNFKDDFAVFLELAFKNNEINTFNEIAFYSKFSFQTLKIMKRIGLGDEGFEKLQNELIKNNENIVLLLKKITNYLNLEDKLRMENKFLQLNQECFLNFNLLIEDLNKYKNYLIDNKK